MIDLIKDWGYIVVQCLLKLDHMPKVPSQNLVGPMTGSLIIIFLYLIII